MLKKKIFIYLLLILFAIIAIYIFGNTKYNTDSVSENGIYLDQIVSSVEGEGKSWDNLLIGANGLEFGHAGRVWVNNIDNTSIVYDKRGNIVKTKDENGKFVELRVKVDGTLSGLLFSPGHKFLKDAFIFTTKEGSVFGWHKGDDGIERLYAVERFAKPDSVFTGITSIENEDIAYLYLADFNNNEIVVLDSEYKRVEWQNKFIDRNLPADYSVYALKQYFGNIYVSYAKKNGQKLVDCAGCGIINVFDQKGNFIKRFESTNRLNIPTTIAFPNSNFMGYKNVALVGSMGSGEISIFDIQSGKYLDSVRDGEKVLRISGLNAIGFGTGNGAGSQNDLFYSSADVRGGTFGKITFRGTNSPGNISKISSLGQSQRQKFDKEIIFNNREDVYQKQINEIEKGCVVPDEEESYLYCLDVRLEEKKKVLSKLKERIQSDLLVLREEFSKDQNFERYYTENAKAIDTMNKLDMSQFIAVSLNQCNLQLIDKYSDETIEQAKSLCVYQKIDNLILDLYAFRASSVRYFVSKDSVIQNPVSKLFQILRDEEEFKADNSY